MNNTGYLKHRKEKQLYQTTLKTNGYSNSLAAGFLQALLKVLRG